MKKLKLTSLGVGFWLSLFSLHSVFADEPQWFQKVIPPQYGTDAYGRVFVSRPQESVWVKGRLIQEPPQTRIDPWGRSYWDGYCRTVIQEVQGDENRSEVHDQVARPENNDGRIRRLPKKKSFGHGVTGELVEEEGEEERQNRHTGNNHGRYILYKWIPGHTDRETKRWVAGHKEEVGEEEVGQDVDQENTEHKAWSYRKD